VTTNAYNALEDPQMTLFDEERGLAERAYLAGLLDGEGWIGMWHPRGSGVYGCRVGIRMTDRQPIDVMFRRYGGTFSLDESSRPSHWRAIFEWKVCGRSCLPVLRDALPFLLVKRLQARIVLAVAASYDGGRLDVMERERRRIAYLVLKSLNARGARDDRLDGWIRKRTP
jgi:hypothetical protein